MVTIEGVLAHEIQQILRWAGYYDGPLTGQYDAATRSALTTLIGDENFEERFDEPGGQISQKVLDLFRHKFSQRTVDPKRSAHS
jgi:hypothetical protein